MIERIPVPSGGPVAGIVARELLLPFEQGEHAAGDRRLGCVVVPDVAGQAGEGQRLVAGSSHQHPSDGDHEHRRQPLEQKAVGEPLGTRSRPEVERLFTREQPLGLAAEDPRQLLVREARLEPEPHRHRRRHERREVREVASEEELARRDEGEEGSEVVRVPPGGVDEEVRVIAARPARSSSGRRSRHGRG